MLVTMAAKNMSYYSNLHHPPVYYAEGRKHVNDYDIEEYRPQVQAFLTRRRSVKREIPPKAWIMKDMGEEYATTYFQQRLVPGEVLYDEQHLKRLSDADDINTQYIHSIFCEEYEKNMIEAIA